MTDAGADHPTALRYATAGDAAALARVDAATSMQPWLAPLFRTEVTRSDRCYVVDVGARGDQEAGDGEAGDGEAGEGEAANGEADDEGFDEGGIVGGVVGYGGLALLAGDAHIMGLAVLPAQQGRGRGRRLLEALCREAALRDAPMTLEVRASNEVAQHLYLSVGFTVSGRRPGYYPDGEDALILWRSRRAATDPSEMPRASAGRGRT